MYLILDKSIGNVSGHEMASNLLLYKILSGQLNINIYGTTYIIKGNTLPQKYAAEIYYQELLTEYNELDSLQSPLQLSAFLAKFGYWSDTKEQALNKLKNDIEDLKVKAFECFFRSNEKTAAKKMIDVARTKMEDLFEQKHRFDALTPHGAATIAKNKYLIATSIYKEDNTPLFGNNIQTFLNSTFPYLDNIIIEINRQNASNEEIRAIARSESWRKYWCAKDSDNVFGKPAIELTDEQLNLISWTRLYDNVYQHPDCPSEEILDDDDCLDGFLIADKRKRDKEKGIMAASDQITNPKIAGAAEVFLVAETPEDAMKIHNLNDEGAKRTISTRNKLIDKEGVISDQDLPDIKQKRQLAINQKAFQLTSGK